jgi:hypothetical protein
MLRDLLREIAAEDGAVRPAELARRLGVERSAVEGMIGELVRLGRLGTERSAIACPLGSMRGSCGRTCAGPEECPLVARLPSALGVARRQVQRRD